MWLEDAKKRCEKATPGPWFWNVNLQSKQIELEGRRKFRETVLAFSRWGMTRAKVLFCSEQGILEDCTKYLEPVAGREHHSDWYQTCNHPDAKFIANARTDLPKALELIERAEKFAEELQDECKARFQQRTDIHKWLKEVEG